MHLPVGPDRATGAPHRGPPHPSGAGDRLDRFRLRRGFEPGDGPAYAAARLAALEQVGRHGGPGPAWRPLGPFAIPHGRTAGSGPGSRPRVAGRVVAVAVDPGDPRHLLAGGGGVWESRDGGRSWAPRADDQPTAAVGAVAFAPGDPAVAYAGTGQGEALAALGVGLLRSGDGGATWRALVAKELLGAGFHDLLVDPEDPGRLLAATTAGLWASADGGLSWEPRLAGRSWAVSHGAAGELLAGGEFGLHRSEDGGATWQRVPLASAPGGFDRVAVAQGPGGQVAYVFAAGDGVGHLWRRGHPGGPFDPVKPPADLDSRRAWHSWACAADPGDPGVVWLGAAGLHRGARGRDGRWSWVDLATRPAGDSLPAGQHALVFETGDPLALYVANEGGLFRSPDGGRTWRSLAPGLAVAEVDRLADHAAWLLAGAGALGALRYEGGEVWCPVGTGDPAVVAGDELVTAGAGGLAVSADGGSTWTAAPLPGVRAAVTALAAAGPDRLLAGTAGGELLRLERAEGAWTVAGTARPRSGRVAGVAVDPARPEVAWAAWSDHRPARARPPEAEDTTPADLGDGRVWRSGDGGATWADRGGGLPEVPVGAVVADPERPGTVVVATDAGVWWSEDDGAGWRPLGAGLPNAPALALALRRPGRLLRVGLLGRGVWELPLEGGSAPEAATPVLRSGRSPAARPRPGGPWWECPDIKLEVPPRPREGPVTPVEFEDDRWPGATGLPELGGRVMPDRLARVHVQVHHRGDGPAAGRPGPGAGRPGLPAATRPAHRRLGPGRCATRRVAVAAGRPARRHRRPGPGPVGGGQLRLAGPLGPASARLPPRGGGRRRADRRGLDQGRAGDRGAVDSRPTPTRRSGSLPHRGTWPGTGQGLVWPSTRPTWWSAMGGGGSRVVTVVGRERERVLMLDLLGSAGRGPFALAAEGWVAELVAGLVLPGRLGGLAREAGLEAERVGELWRPELVTLVREDPRLAERVDLASAFAIPPGRRGRRARAVAPGNGAVARPARPAAAAAPRTATRRARMPAAAGRRGWGARRAHLPGGPVTLAVSRRGRRGPASPRRGRGRARRSGGWRSGAASPWLSGATRRRRRAGPRPARRAGP